MSMDMMILHSPFSEYLFPNVEIIIPWLGMVQLGDGLHMFLNLNTEDSQTSHWTDDVSLWKKT